MLNNLNASQSESIRSCSERKIMISSAASECGKALQMELENVGIKEKQRSTEPGWRKLQSHFELKVLLPDARWCRPQNQATRQVRVPRLWAASLLHFEPGSRDPRRPQRPIPRSDPEHKHHHPPAPQTRSAPPSAASTSTFFAFSFFISNLLPL